MNRYQVSKQVVQIFPAALLSQRKIWESTISPTASANTCLLVTDTKTPKQTQLMRRVAQSFRDAGWQIVIWIPPSKTKNLAHQ